ncbi:MAG: DMT family transporter, partial [Oscillospiraceae bacterium]|nr:DMT family transporter [Oscillospiraceae bacterium]
MKNKDLALAYGAIGLYALITGFSFMVVKSGVGLSTSLQNVTYRFTAALLVGLVLMACRAVKISWKGGNKKRLLFTALTYVGFLGFQAWGLMYTTSIVSGIMFAAVPILAKIVAGFVLGEKTTWVQNGFACLSVGAV